MNTTLNTIFISDFVIDPLAHCLEEPFNRFSLNSTIAPFGQVRQVIFNEKGEEWKNRQDVAIIWTKPENQIPAFNKLIMNNKWDFQAIQSEIEDFANSIKMLATRVKIVIIPKWTLRADYHGNGAVDLKNGIGIANMLMRMNLQFIDALDELKNIYFLDASRWYSLVSEPDNDRMWYLGKIPFSQDFFEKAAEDIRSTVNAVFGKTCKMLVLDLDNTLWGGIIGDDGMKGIRVGGIDPIGEAFVDFQKSILALKNRGILLSIASKNEENIAMEVFENHSEMILKKEDFVTWRINWNDKAQNIKEIANEINIGLDSLVFIDDNPAERDRVKTALPQVNVPDWPDNPLMYKRTLNLLSYFNKPSFSKEDRLKTKLYHNEKKRKAQLSGFACLDDWLKSLEIKISYQECSDPNRARAVQLLNKTNQFNLCTRRMDEKTFLEYSQNKINTVLIFNCRDKFGEYGDIGLVSLKMEEEKNEAQIEDFLLSCRCMGKGIEYSMISVASDFVRKNNKTVIRASYFPTDRNKPCADFLSKCHFQKIGRNDFINKKINEIKSPEHIIIK